MAVKAPSGTSYSAKTGLRSEVVKKLWDGGFFPSYSMMTLKQSAAGEYSVANDTYGRYGHSAFDLDLDNFAETVTAITEIWQPILSKNSTEKTDFIEAISRISKHTPGLKQFCKGSKTLHDNNALSLEPVRQALCQCSPMYYEKFAALVVSLGKEFPQILQKATADEIEKIAEIVGMVFYKENAVIPRTDTKFGVEHNLVAAFRMLQEAKLLGNEEIRNLFYARALDKKAPQCDLELVAKCIVGLSNTKNPYFAKATNLGPIITHVNAYTNVQNLIDAVKSITDKNLTDNERSIVFPAIAKSAGPKEPANFFSFLKSKKVTIAQVDVSNIFSINEKACIDAFGKLKDTDCVRNENLRGLIYKYPNEREKIVEFLNLYHANNIADLGTATQECESILTSQTPLSSCIFSLNILNGDSEKSLQNSNANTRRAVFSDSKEIVEMSQQLRDNNLSAPNIMRCAVREYAKDNYAEDNKVQLQQIVQTCIVFKKLNLPDDYVLVGNLVNVCSENPACKDFLVRFCVTLKQPLPAPIFAADEFGALSKALQRLQPIKNDKESRQASQESLQFFEQVFFSLQDFSSEIRHILYNKPGEPKEALDAAKNPATTSPSSSSSPHSLSSSSDLFSSSSGTPPLTPNTERFLDSLNSPPTSPTKFSDKPVSMRLTSSDSSSTSTTSSRLLSLSSITNSLLFTPATLPPTQKPQQKNSTSSTSVKTF